MHNALIVQTLVSLHPETFSPNLSPQCCWISGTVSPFYYCKRELSKECRLNSTTFSLPRGGQWPGVSGGTLVSVSSQSRSSPKNQWYSLFFRFLGLTCPSQQRNLSSMFLSSPVGIRTGSDCQQLRIDRRIIHFIIYLVNKSIAKKCRSNIKLHFVSPPWASSRIHFFCSTVTPWRDCLSRRLSQDCHFEPKATNLAVWATDVANFSSRQSMIRTDKRDIWALKWQGGSEC